MNIKIANPLYKSHLFIVSGISFCIVCLYVMLAVLPDLRNAVPFLVLISAAVIILLAVLQTLSDRCGSSMPAWLIMAFAAVIRIMFVFRPPELSDDIFRYVFDGLQMVCGNNPYALAPAGALPQTPAAAMIWASVNHPELVTIYPPGAQVVFLGAALFGPRVWVFKCLVIFMDLCSCAIVLRLLKRFGLPAQRSILYAWHPLVVLEIAGSGHIDAAGIFFFFLSLLTAVTGFFQGKSKCCFAGILSGVFYAWSCLIKLFPVLFFPLLLKHIPRKNRLGFAAGALSGFLLLCLPFLPHLKNMAPTLFQYARHWEFSGFSFFWLKQIHMPGDASRYILSAAFIVAVCVIWFPTLGSLSGNNPREMRAGDFYPIYRINLAFLFLSPTLHPWYALYLASVLPFVALPAGLILSWSVLLAYAVLIPYALTGHWVENSLATNLICLGPVAAIFIMQAMARICPAVSKTVHRQRLPGK